MRLALMFIVALALTPLSSAEADVIIDWNQHVFTSADQQIQRTLAMVHIAMFDATNAIEPQFTPYLALPAAPWARRRSRCRSGRGGTRPAVSGAQATLDAALASSLATVPDGPAENAGVAFGDLVAEAIFEARLVITS